jgi:UDP-N-acetylmuramoylalanine--D-glutamate ligase
VTGRFEGTRAGVVGLAASGRAAAQALAAEGAIVRVTEARPVAELAASGDDPSGLDPSIEVLAGGHRPEHLVGATLVVTSPGVRQGAHVLRWAAQRRLPVWSELELGARVCGVPFVAVTGTNGKTTTTELVAAAMRAGGLRARACGNVGYPFSAAAREPFDALAVECSSFQLRFTDAFHPRVSVLLNVAPDHLDWHGSFAAYAAAKARVYARQGEGDVHVGNLDDAGAAAMSRRAPCPVRWFREGSPRPGEVGVVDGEIVARGVEAASADPATGHPGGDVSLGRPELAPRFLVDAAAASAAALAFGVPPAAAREAVCGFRPAPHRGEVVARAGMVNYLDDSKATNPHAALASLAGMRDVVLVAGGLAKGVDLSPLATAAARLRAVVAIGDAAPDLARVFEGLVPVTMAGSIEDAVEASYGLARPDRAVLLAPACASQDMFTDYRERGERFAAAARALADRVGRSHANRG